jgi:hypothetical protein
MNAAPIPFARVITEDERIECVALAQINEEHAAGLPAGFDTFRKVMQLNAELLRKLADAPRKS